MKIQLNGTEREVPDESSLGAVVCARPGVAAALNGAVVRDWDRVMLSDGDAVEVLTAFQGG